MKNERQNMQLSTQMSNVDSNSETFAYFNFIGLSINDWIA